MQIALIGNPNTGKSTLFNTLTGSHQHTGNWPGKTVEKKEGTFKHEKKSYSVIDLPGIYSLNTISIEEQIARDYILKERPDVIIDVIDSSNIDRNLYLAVQLIELEIPIVIVLNFAKEAKGCGRVIDEKKLAKLLKVPVIAMEAKDKKSIPDLMKVLDKVKPSKALRYGDWLDEAIVDMEGRLKGIIIKDHSNHLLALKLIENDPLAVRLVSKEKKGEGVLKEAEEIRNHIKSRWGDEPENVIADARYGVVSGCIKGSTNGIQTSRRKLSKKIDKVMTNRLIGIPIFLFIMWLMFQATFTVAGPLVGLIDNLFGYLKGVVAASTSGWVSSLLADGLIAGVGGVLVFLPNIFILFLLIAVLEDSGYLARAAFIMDGLMKKIGLHGKSFIPLVLGFGCNVPAIMATRTLQNERERVLTILINPLMSCSARLPVYVLFVSAFFVDYQGLIIFSLYLLGILLAILMGLLFKNTLFKGQSSPFIMELPPYRVPTLFGVFLQSWNRTKHFIKKAGTVILAAVVLVWFLGSLPVGVEFASQDSVIGQVGEFVSPVFEPAGFGDWKASVSLVFGVIAKEVVVGTMSTLYSVGEESLASALTADFTPLSAYAFLVMILIYIPCIATLAVIRKETASAKWMWLSVGYTLALGWIVAVVVYQGGLLLGLGP